LLLILGSGCSAVPASRPGRHHQCRSVSFLWLSPSWPCYGSGRSFRWSYSWRGPRVVYWANRGAYSGVPIITCGGRHFLLGRSLSCLLRIVCVHVRCCRRWLLVDVLSVLSASSCSHAPRSGLALAVTLMVFARPVRRCCFGVSSPLRAFPGAKNFFILQWCLALRCVRSEFLLGLDSRMLWLKPSRNAVRILLRIIAFSCVRLCSPSLL